MDIWHVRGGNRLFGSCRVQGSKNASLPVLAASIVFPARSRVRNVPRLRDVDAAVSILSHLGCRVAREENELYIDSGCVADAEIPRELMAEMRSSVIFMGALLARCGEARLSLPGGCQLGKRPIDLHLSALRSMGAEISEEGSDIFCRAEKLRGAEIDLRFPSVGATENIMLAACAAEGRTTIHGAAREPEIAALQDARGAHHRSGQRQDRHLRSISAREHGLYGTERPHRRLDARLRLRGGGRQGHPFRRKFRALFDGSPLPK